MRLCHTRELNSGCLHHSSTNYEHNFALHLKSPNTLGNIILKCTYCNVAPMVCINLPNHATIMLAVVCAKLFFFLPEKDLTSKDIYKVILKISTLKIDVRLKLGLKM